MYNEGLIVSGFVNLLIYVLNIPTIYFLFIRMVYFPKKYIQ